MPERRTAVTALAVFVASFLVYALLVQSQPFGDGISYLDWLSEGRLYAHHVLYLPDMWLVTRPAVLLGVSERTAAFLFSAFCGAAGNTVLYVLLRSSRSLAPDCLHPLLWTIAVATTPLVMFFATTLENHAHQYAWGCVFLLALDRAIGRSMWWWLLAGLALTLAFASHSSMALLMPAVVLLSRRASGAKLLSLPKPAERARLAVLVAPVVVFKLIEKELLVRLLGAPASWRETAFSLRFTLDLWSPKSAGQLLDYAAAEVLLPAAGLWAGVVLLALRRRADWLLVLAAVLPHFLVFGHWPVRELGAYYIVVIVVVAVAAARSGRLQPALRFVIAAGLAGQLAVAVHQAWSWVDTRTRPAWEIAAGARELTGPKGTVFFWRGVDALHAKHDHGLHTLALENWVQFLAGYAAQDRRFWHKLAEGDWSKHLGESPRPFVVSGDLVENIRRPPLRPLWETLDRKYRLEPARRRAFVGFRVLPKQ